MDLRKEFIKLKTWIWERHDIGIPTAILDEYLYEKGYDKMPRLTEAQIKAMANSSNENSGLHKHFVSNNEVAVCDHPPSELKLDSGGFKFCKNCGTYPQTDC